MRIYFDCAANALSLYGTYQSIMNYEEFLASKRHLVGEFGFEPEWFPDCAFDFQRHIISWAIRKGRAAIFADTGLGKTLIQLAIAENVIRKTNGRVLILTPLAVAFQFITEAAKIGVGDISHSRRGELGSKIVVTNYERLKHFNPENFEAVILDESSILKNFEGAIKHEINVFIRKVKYRFLSTATPSPNDFVELGTSSEALGYLGYTDMLQKYFTNNENTVSPMGIGVKWVLKGHATEDFWRWVASWSISIRKPSDIGFDDSRYVLPELIINDHFVVNKTPLVIGGQTSLFAVEAHGLKEIRSEGAATTIQRCEKAVELTIPWEASVYWTILNKEADLIEKMDTTAVQVRGAMNIDKKEEILLAFASGEIRRLITKPSITAFGLNWQHCNHTTYFPDYSYERFYQSIRRFWRFGQTQPVTADLVLSDGQTKLIRSLKEKREKAESMFSILTRMTSGENTDKAKAFTQIIQPPKFI